MAPTARTIIFNGSGEGGEIAESPLRRAGRFLMHWLGAGGGVHPMSNEQPIETGSFVKALREIHAGVIVQVAGPVNLGNAAEVRESLMRLAEQHRPGRLILDLAGVPYIDSSGLAVLIEVLRKVREWGGKVVLFGLQSRVEGLVEIARLKSLFSVAKDEQAALGACRGE